MREPRIHFATHAELKIGDSRFMVNDVIMGTKGPKAFVGSPAGLWLFVTSR